MNQSAFEHGNLVKSNVRKCDMGSEDCNVDINLLMKCSLDKCRQLLHQLIDGMCGRSPALYTSFADIWTLEEWWLVTDCLRAIILDSFAKGWSAEQLSEKIALLSDEHRQLFVDVHALRHEDVQRLLVDKVNAVSHASLTNFDWKAKLALSSDRMAGMWQPLLNIELALESHGENKSVQLELDKEELKILIAAMESAERALAQLV